MANYDLSYRWAGTLPVTSGDRTICVTATGNPSPLPSHQRLHPVESPLPPSDGLNYDVFEYWGTGGMGRELGAAFPDLPAFRQCVLNSTGVAPIAQYARAIFVYETMSVID